MPFHLAAYYKSVDPAGAYDSLTPVPDRALRISGDDLIVPPDLTEIIAVAFGIEDAAEAFGQLVSPSLRAMPLPQFEPHNGGSAAAIEPASPHIVADLRQSPLPVVRGEQLNAQINSNPVAAQAQWALLWLADKAVEVVGGKIFPVHATNGTTLVAGAWTNGALTFDNDLPRGRYQVVGMRARSAGLVAARLVLSGWPWYPGVMGTDAVTDLEHPMFRSGGLGVFLEFEDDLPPTVDFLSVSADTAQDVILDLIQVRGGPS